MTSEPLAPLSLNSPVQSPAPSRRWFAFASVAVLVALFHWPLLLSNSLLWDDITLDHAVKSGQSRLLVTQFTDAGAPHWGWMHVGLGQLPGAVHWYKAAALGCLIGASLALTVLLQSDKRLAPGDARVIAVMAAAYPFYAQWHGLITLPYAVCYLLFFVGAAIYRMHVAAGTVFSRWALAAFPLLALSFTIESFGVLFYGALGYFFVDALVRSANGWGRVAREFAWRHWPAFLLPILIYGGKRLLFPMKAAYAGYNQVAVTTKSVAEGFEDFGKRTLCDPIVDAMSCLVEQPALFVVLFLAGLILGGVCLVGLGPWRKESTNRYATWMLLAAIALFVCGAFPYIAVGKSPRLNNYESRHALLMGLPYALATFALARWLFRRPRWAGAALAIVLAGWFVCQSHTYMLWQTRFIKSEAIAANLSDCDERLPRVVIIDDRADFGMTENWRTYEIHAMLREATGNERRMGCDLRCYPKSLEALKSHPEQWRYLGCGEADCTLASNSERAVPSASSAPVRVVINDATTASDTEIYWRALTVKDRAAYVKSLVRIELLPLKDASLKPASLKTAVSVLPGQGRR